MKAATIVGTVDSERRAVVDGAGRVIIRPGEWALDWAIGADDRWHHPADEASTRQTLVAWAPVVETRMRIPSGDAVQRVFAIRGPSAEGGHEYVVVEVANDSPVPVAVGFSIRPDPFAPASAPPVARLEPDGAVVSVDGAPGVVFAAPPTAQDELGYLLPVPHRTRVRVVLPLTATSSYPTVVPSPDQVAAGWEAQVRRGAEADLPDAGMQARFEIGRRQLLLRCGGDHAFDPHGESTLTEAVGLAVALDEYGFHPEAGLLLAGLVERADRDDVTAQLLVPALVRHEDLADDAALVRATRRFVRRASKKVGRPEQLPVGARDEMSALRDLIVRDVSPDLELLGGWQPSWAGQPVEAHRLPTRFGVLSFGVRWHGDRPALLWELTPRDGATVPTVRLPALGPAWTGEGAAGEALLAPVTPPAQAVDS